MGNTNAELSIDISDDVLILSGTNNIMTFSISGVASILDDPGEALISNIESNVLYINYEGSN